MSWGNSIAEHIQGRERGEIFVEERNTEGRILTMYRVDIMH